MQYLLTVYPQLAVVRCCEEKDLYAISSDGRKRVLKENALGPNLISMSVNLLGGAFKRKHLCFRPQRHLVKTDWDGKSIPNAPIESNSYSVLNATIPVYFRISEINKFAFPYCSHITASNYHQYKLNANKIKTRYNLDIEDEIIGSFGYENNNMTLAYARAYINHHPNILNYWHMQMDVYTTVDNKLIDYEDNSGEAKRIRRSLREHISRIAIERLDKRYNINQIFYTKDKPFWRKCCFGISRVLGAI